MFYIFREYVGGILSPQDFAELDVLVTDALLDPQILHIKMSHLAQSPPARYTYSGSCVRVDTQWHVDIEISSHGSEAKRILDPTTCCAALTLHWRDSVLSAWSPNV